MADQKIDGALFKSMVIEGALAIAENKERANELNVFPVPDGDTGTNTVSYTHLFWPRRGRAAPSRRPKSYPD